MQVNFGIDRSREMPHAGAMFGRRPYRELERKLGYRFRHAALLEAALTHPSYRHETPGVAEDNQRLEFLGDAALALLTAAWLYHQHPDEAEGGLTQRRSSLTRSRALAEAGRRLGLGEVLRLGRGELKNGGRTRDGVLEDAVEAVIGAAFVDGGLKAAQRVFDRCLLSYLLAAPTPGRWDNPKGALLEWCQRHGAPSPRYEVVAESGPMHQRVFVVRVVVAGTVETRGSGLSKKSAEQQAATAALLSLCGDSNDAAPS